MGGAGLCGKEAAGGADGAEAPGDPAEAARGSLDARNVGNDNMASLEGGRINLHL